MKLSYAILAVCVLSLAACDTAGTREPEAVTTTEAFTPQEVTAADIPPDLYDDSWARLPTITRESLDAADPDSVSLRNLRSNVAEMRPTDTMTTTSTTRRTKAVPIPIPVRIAAS